MPRTRLHGLPYSLELLLLLVLVLLQDLSKRLVWLNRSIFNPRSRAVMQAP